MRKRVGILLMGLFVFASMSVLSFAQDAAPGAGAGTTHQGTVNPKEKKVHKRVEKKHRAPKHKKVKKDNEAPKDNNAK